MPWCSLAITSTHRMLFCVLCICYHMAHPQWRSSTTYVLPKNNPIMKLVLHMGFPIKALWVKWQKLKQTNKQTNTRHIKQLSQLEKVEFASKQYGSEVPAFSHPALLISKDSKRVCWWTYQHKCFPLRYLAQPVLLAMCRTVSEESGRHTCFGVSRGSVCASCAAFGKILNFSATFP